MKEREDPLTQIAFRIPRSWIRDAGAIAARLSTPGMRITRTDIFRMAIAQGMIALKLKAERKPA